MPSPLIRLLALTTLLAPAGFVGCDAPGGGSSPGGPFIGVDFGHATDTPGSVDRA